ncbi:MAG: anaerobic sulfatase maturase [Chloroflexi bacterium]|nr:MAG: anaerobic sulfatase maturase [Chloroflexota bacterium]
MVPMSPASPPSAFHVLAKPTGAICNLDCRYCFFLSKEMLYPDSDFRMPEEVLEAYIRQLIEAHSAPEVIIAWQGGEPTLMGLEFFRRAVRYAEKYRKPGQRIRHSLQTNGTRLDDAWCAFFKDHDFLVGISIDGPRELHDAYRVDKGGRGSFGRVLEGYELLRKHAVDVNILCTVHAANQRYPLEVYRFFRDELGARFLQFIPIVERVSDALAPAVAEGWSGGKRGGRPFYRQAGDRVTERSVGAEQYGRFLTTVFDEWVRQDVGRVFVQIFDVALGAWYGAPPSLCVFSPTCGNALALEHNGDLYACDHYVEPEYLLGNILETPMMELVASPRQRKFGQEKVDGLPRYCRACDVRFVCHGGCPKNRFVQTPDGESGLNYLCAGYRLFFRHIDRPMRIMADLLRHGRAPAEIMGLLREEDASLQAAIARAGRNDPCPCGSGRKVKHCHGR